MKENPSSTIESPQISRMREPGRLGTALLRKAVLAVMLAAPSSAEGGGITSGFEKEMKDLGFETMGLPVSEELFYAGAWLTDRGADQIAGSICSDCCNDSPLEVIEGSVPNLKQTRTLDNELLLKVRLKAASTPLGVGTELGLTKVSSATVTLEDLTLKQVDRNSINPILHDRLCMRNLPGDDKVLVVTQVLLAKPTFTLKDARGKTLAVTPEGIPILDAAFKMKLTQTTTGTFESKEPLVVGYKVDKFDKTGMEQFEKALASAEWKERHEDCEEKNEKYCAELESVRAANDQCADFLSNKEAGTLSVTWTSKTADWVESDPACSTHQFLEQIDVPYDPLKCDTFSRDGKWCASKMSLVVVPEQGERFKNKSDINMDELVTSSGSDSSNWYTRDFKLTPNSASITVVSYGAGHEVSFCLSQEALKEDVVRTTDSYQFEWGKTTGVKIPKVGDTSQVTASYTSLGVSVEAPNLNAVLVNGESRSTDTLEYMKEENPKGGDRQFFYRPIAPCKPKAEPKPPVECSNCGTFTCEGH